MLSQSFGRLCLAVVITLGAAAMSAQHGAKPMSLHNRLLLNRLAVNGQRTLEVLLLTRLDEFEEQLRRIEALGGDATRAEPPIGYVRATMPLAKLVELIDVPGIEAYQIASLSKAGWYRDGVSRENAEMFRRYESSPIVPPELPAPTESLPPLTVEAAHRINLAADRDVGLDEWLEQHPTYDGRGVTIALLESAQAEFNHPAFRSATTLEGSKVPKFAGIFNPIAIDEPDDTRVELTTEFTASSAWHRIGARTYIVPRPGTYRFGIFTVPAGASQIYQFAVLRDVASNEIWVDSDGDGDLREEAPSPPSVGAIHTRQLRIQAPRDVRIAFAVTEGHSPQHINVYLAVDGHQTMTASVAAGNRSDDSLAYGAAPGARVLLVRNSAADLSLRATLEAYLDTIRRPDVDILCDSAGIDMVPGTAADFTGLFMARVIAAYDKPIVHSAGNANRQLASTWSLGDVFAVGGALSPDTFALLYGGGTIGSMMVDPRVSAGPALDGALKPDFIAPVSRVAANMYLDATPLDLPVNAPHSRAPTGYQISCCSSASSPFAAGVVALLMSAAKQAGVRYSVSSLGRALHAGAQPLPNWPSHQQGSGLVHVGRAWIELLNTTEVPAITVTGPNNHPLSAYAARGSRGPGLFERDGWQVGTSAERALTVRRTSGPARSLTYRLVWHGNDGTFDTRASIRLPLDRSVPLPVLIQPRSTGVHSAVLQLQDDATGTLAVQTLLTVVTTEPVDRTHERVDLHGTLTPLLTKEHFFTVPPDAQAMRVELTVVRGSLSAALVRGDGLSRKYHWHLDPSATRVFPEGRHSLIVPLPTPGTWGVTLSNGSAVQDVFRTNVSVVEAEYKLSVTMLDASVEPRVMSDETVAVDIANHAGAIAEPVLETSTGTLRTHEGTTSTDGRPQQFTIDVPPSTTTLRLALRSADDLASPLDLFLYDCTTGECFSYDFSLPATSSQTFIVRDPMAGRWVATVNSAPSPAEQRRFVLEEIVTGGVTRHSATQRVGRTRGARWTEQVNHRLTHAPTSSDSTPIVLFELVDAAAEREALAHPWENREGLPNLARRRAAIGTAVLRVR